jgi:regulator of protease activity HflC (stomatin/prohibitin superfamily)
MFTSYVFIAIAIVVVFVIARTAIVVPQQSAYVIESLGKYSRTLHAGFHILVPFVERVAYKHSLKEQALDVAEQICITRDNVQVGVDAVLYMQVLDPQLASRSRSWRRPLCAARSARSSSTGRSKRAASSMPTLSPNSTRPRAPGASR